MFAILGRSFWLLVFLSVLFGWMGLVGVVRAEFLRARNLEYVRAAKALGVSNLKTAVSDSEMAAISDSKTAVSESEIAV